MGDHEKLIIRQVNKPYDTEKALRNVLNYIVRQKDCPQDVEVRY